MTDIKKLTKEGREAQRSAVHLLELLSEQELQMLSEWMPQYKALLTRGFDAMSPGGEEANLARFRNRALQSAAQSGKGASALAKWAGLGSGAEGAAINDAMFQGQRDVDEFAQYLSSPEYFMSAADAGRSYMTPGLLGTSLSASGQLRQNQPPKPKKPGLLGGLLGTAAQLYGAGAFGGVGGAVGGAVGRKSAIGAL